MPILRDRPYGRFNFLVDLGTGETDGPDAGFEECGPLVGEMKVIEYRNGNSKENSPQKITGLIKYDNVALRRGVIGSRPLYDWFDQVRNGDENAMRTVRISLQSEDHSHVVQTWLLSRARPLRYAAGPLNGGASEVALEELTLAFERLEVD